MGTRRQWALAGAAAVLALAGLAVAGLRHRSRFAGHWDPRIVPIVRFVERARGRQFAHPVTVELLAPDRFQAALGGAHPLTAADRAALDVTVAELRAVGLVSGQVDLTALAAQSLKDDVLGVYQPGSKHIVVRGTQLTPAVRVTLAHELTHALQDQEVDLGSVERRQGVAGLAGRAVVEGDAVVVEQAYAGALSPADADSYRKERAAGLAPAGSTGVPAALSDQTVFPYLFGPTFVRAIRQSGGAAAIDRALRHPPEAQADILEPGRWLRGLTPVSVPSPRIGPGDRAVGRAGPFGQFSLFQVLASRVAYRQAWNAVNGWQGDRAVIYRQGRSTCVAVTTAFSTGDQASRFTVAAGQWAATLAGATVAGRGATVELRSCEQEPAPPLPPPVDPPPFRVLSLRASIVGAFLDEGSRPTVAECAADQVIDRVGASQLITYDNGAASADVAGSIIDAGRQATATCRSSPAGASTG